MFAQVQWLYRIVTYANFVEFVRYTCTYMQNTIVVPNAIVVQTASSASIIIVMPDLHIHNLYMYNIYVLHMYIH